MSSGDVYRNHDGVRGVGTHSPDPVPLAETAPLRETRYPYRGYDGLNFEYAEEYDKILVENVVLNASDTAEMFGGTVVRLPAVYGPRGAHHRLGDALVRMDDDRPAILMGETDADWRWTHGYVENVGAAIAHVATHPDAGGSIYNVGEVDTPTARERIQALADVVGWDGNIVTLPAEDLPEHVLSPFDCRYDLAIDTRRICDQLKFEAPVSMDEALRRTVEWERTHRDESTEREAQYAVEDAALQDSA